MEIIINDNVNRLEWKEFLSGNCYESAFQSPEFYDLFNSVKTLGAEVLAIVSEGSIKALCLITLQGGSGIKGFLTRRAIIYGGPLFDPEYPECLDYLLRQISNKFSNVIYIESRNLSSYNNLKPLFKRQGFRYVPYLNFVVRTSDLISVSNSISNSRMRQIKKAFKSSVTWKEASNEQDIIYFYQILSDLYKYKIRKPLLPQEFFIEFYRRNLGRYLLVWFNHKIIGGIMCPVLGRKAIYEFYVCGLDSDFREQYPSVMATWAAIEYANQNNIEIFDFMGAGKPEEEYGVREFKSKFGGELVEYGRFVKICRPIMYKIGKLGIQISGFLKK